MDHGLFGIYVNELERECSFMTDKHNSVLLKRNLRPALDCWFIFTT